MLDAALAGDADCAVAELTAHIQRTTDALLAPRAVAAPVREQQRMAKQRSVTAGDRPGTPVGAE